MICQTTTTVASTSSPPPRPRPPLPPRYAHARTHTQVVTYAWDMHDLRAFLKRRPLIGASLQKAMAEDFINKVYQSRGHEERYRLLLVESLDPGSINPIGREKLQRYVCMYNTQMGDNPRWAIFNFYYCIWGESAGHPRLG